MSEQLEALQREREGLIVRFNAIEEKRREISASIIRANRMSGVSKRTVAALRAQDVEMLQEFNDVKRKLGDIKIRIKDLNRMNSGRVSTSLAEEFVRVAKSMMPREMFEDVMNVASDNVQQGENENERT